MVIPTKKVLFLEAALSSATWVWVCDRVCCFTVSHFGDVGAYELMNLVMRVGKVYLFLSRPSQVCGNWQRTRVVQFKNSTRSFSIENPCERSICLEIICIKESSQHPLFPCGLSLFKVFIFIYICLCFCVCVCESVCSAVQTRKRNWIPWSWSFW